MEIWKCCKKYVFFFRKPSSAPSSVKPKQAQTPAPPVIRDKPPSAVYDKPPPKYGGLSYTVGGGLSRITVGAGVCACLDLTLDGADDGFLKKKTDFSQH